LHPPPIAGVNGRGLAGVSGAAITIFWSPTAEPVAFTAAKVFIGNPHERVLKNLPAPLAGKKPRPYVAAKRSFGRENQRLLAFSGGRRAHASLVFSIS
jgi:hypothetical protein